MSDDFYESDEYKALVKPHEERMIEARRELAERKAKADAYWAKRKDIGDAIRYMLIIVMVGTLLAIPVTFLAVLLP